MALSQLPLVLPLVPRKDVRVDFDGGELSSDGGWLLLSLADQQLALTRRMATAIADPREQDQVTHPLEALLSQRVYQIAQGYEDANDAQTLRKDPLLKVAVGRAPSAGPLAGQSTFSRLENAVTATDLERLEYLLQDLFVERCGAAPKRIVLDLDPYDAPAHGQQQGVLFNGYYDGYCYLPLVICGTVDGGPQRLIGVVLRDGKAPPTEEAVGFLQDLVPVLREKYPDVALIARGDGGYGVPVMIEACRALNVRFCFGKAQNPVLLRLAEPTVARGEAAEAVREAQGRRRRTCRVFGEFTYQAREWKQPERVVTKWECPYGTPNPRFVVTDLTGPEWGAHAVHRFYCARGDRENRIKEFKLDLSGGRLSCQTFLANQFRLVLHAAAYVLYQALQETVREVAPKHELATAQAGTLRSRFLKVAARIRERRRLIRIHLCSSFPLQDLWQRVVNRLLPART